MPLPVPGSPAAARASPGAARRSPDSDFKFSAPTPGAGAAARRACPALAVSVIPQWPGPSDWTVTVRRCSRPDWRSESPGPARRAGVAWQGSGTVALCPAATALAAYGRPGFN